MADQGSSSEGGGGGGDPPSRCLSLSNQPHQQREKRSKHAQDPSGSSKLPSGCTKQAYCRGASSGQDSGAQGSGDPSTTRGRGRGCGHGRGHGARGRGGRGQGQHDATDSPLIGAQWTEFIPEIGDVPVITEEEQALNKAGRTIAEGVCPYTPFTGPTEFNLSWLIPFPRQLSVCQPAYSSGGFAPHLMKDYRNNVPMLRKKRSENPYDDGKDLQIESHFWSLFHFDYYHYVIFHRTTPKWGPLVVPMQYIDMYHLWTHMMKSSSSFMIWTL